MDLGINERGQSKKEGPPGSAHSGGGFPGITLGALRRLKCRSTFCRGHSTYGEGIRIGEYATRYILVCNEWTWENVRPVRTMPLRGAQPPLNPPVAGGSDPRTPRPVGVGKPPTPTDRK